MEKPNNQTVANEDVEKVKKTAQKKDKTSTEETQKAHAEEVNKAQEKTHENQDDFKEKFLRLNADFKNFQRRIEKERFEWMFEARVEVLKKILPLFDELDRAIALSAQNNTDQESTKWLDGFKLIQKNWQKAFKELGITEIKELGRFNPEIHDALMQVEDKKVQPGDVTQLLSKGYKYQDKVIQHAKVSVAK